MTSTAPTSANSGTAPGLDAIPRSAGGLVRVDGGGALYVSARGDSMGRVLLKILYWLAVLVISLALLVALILFFESRDESSVDEGAVPVFRA
jgi:hypothetical protein